MTKKNDWTKNLPKTIKEYYKANMKPSKRRLNSYRSFYKLSKDTVRKQYTRQMNYGDPISVKIHKNR